jgi:lipid II:glycine glycyltransferase (peptidoglycan interpeptide bridge formation enzyme)
MSKIKVLTEAEIENIKKVREDFQILVGNVGEVEVAIINLNKKKKELENELLLIQEKETKIAVDLEKKYGKGNISLETGEFTPIE